MKRKASNNTNVTTSGHPKCNLTKFNKFKENFLEYYKFPTPLFAQSSKMSQIQYHPSCTLFSRTSETCSSASSDAEEGYIRLVLRSPFRNQSNDEFGKFLNALRGEYRPVEPLSPITSPVIIDASSEIQISSHSLDDNDSQTIDIPVWYCLICNGGEVALATDTSVLAIRRIENPSFRPKRYQRKNCKPIKESCSRTSYFIFNSSTRMKRSRIPSTNGVVPVATAHPRCIDNEWSNRSADSCSTADQITFIQQPRNLVQRQKSKSIQKLVIRRNKFDDSYEIVH